MAVRKDDDTPMVRCYQGRCWWPSAKTATVAQASAPADYNVLFREASGEAMGRA